jgi:adenylate cyclase
MGIHSGPVNQIVDVNNRSNIAGAGIDVAQRVMDCGDAGHILLSKRVAEDLSPFPRWNPHLHDLGECEVKHGRKVSLVNFYTDKIGNPEPPNKCQEQKGRPKTGAPARPLRLTSLSFIAAALLAFIALGLIISRLVGIPQRREAVRVQSDAQDERHSAASLPNTKSIAVLPFENLSHDPENAYFADGIQEEILTRLSKIADLKVISRTSTQRYKSAPENLLEIAKQLGVANILEGSVQKSADQVRVNVQLINAQNDSHLWAEKYDRKLTDIFGVESEIATKIADTLRAKLTGAEQHAIAAHPTENSEAHEAFLKGLYYWYKYPGPDFEKSRDYFQQAVDLDLTYAPGYAGLSYYYGFKSAIGLAPPNDNWPKAEAAANKALELDDTSPDAYNALAATKLYYYRDWPAAERYFRRGIELNPNSAEIHHHYALCLLLFGPNEEMLTQMRRSAELDPLARRNNLDRAKMFFTLRQYDPAIDQFRATLDLYPDFATAHEWLGYAYEKKGMQRESIAEWSKALTLSGQAEEASIFERAYSTSGFEKAVFLLAQKKLDGLNERRGRGQYISAEEYVVAYVRLGDKEHAFTWLAKAVQERNRFALEFKSNPLLDPLRGDPRFEKLVNQVVPLETK